MEYLMSAPTEQLLHFEGRIYRNQGSKSDVKGLRRNRYEKASDYEGYCQSDGCKYSDSVKGIIRKGWCK